MAVCPLAGSFAADEIVVRRMPSVPAASSLRNRRRIPWPSRPALAWARIRGVMSNSFQPSPGSNL